MKKKLLLFSLIFLFFGLNIQAKSELFIVLKIDNEIITNQDIKQEIKYLIAINNQLETINSKEIEKYAKQSLIKEKIKEKELLKYFELNQENEFLENYMKDFYKKMKLDNKEQFKEYLTAYDLTIEHVRKKFEIETVWNELIYTKYKDQVNIDIESIKKKLKRDLDNKQLEIKSFELSEILYQTVNKSETKEKYEKIFASINDIGFNNTANIFSTSDSSKFGGKIGWVNERQLSKNILSKIKDLKIGEISDPIIIPSGTIILKIEDLKKEKADYNFEDELKKIITFEKNRQFNQFSSIYYNKIKFNSKINES
tara:strand:- start:32 stop:967 length:936 start_codon:yes stop_codon:yes gene_type:complete